jgi:signal transduction histidine kinase
VRYLTRQLNVRFDERLAERMRNAQELHDTLLQGFVSASMQLHVGIALLPADSPALPVLGRVAELMGSVIEEGRSALRGLRTPGDLVSLDLETALERVQREVGADGRSDFKVVVDGRPRPLHPLVRDEVYGIARQALTDAFRRPDARVVRVELVFGARRLRVRVRDDGRGGGQLVENRDEDSPGVIGRMRERAERIGATLEVSHHQSGGTELELSVPGYTAYQGQSSSRAVRWLERSRPIRWPGRTATSANEEDE